MPMIGRPGNQSRNSYSDIAIKKAEIQGNGTPVDPKIGDELNKMVGVKPDQRFVDRKAHETLGPDGFMKLLAHQLKNQDPMKPMDQKDFSSNLAQFSQLEQLTAMNKKMDGMNANNDNEKRFQGASYLGKKVVTRGTTVDYNGEGKDVELPFYLDKSAKNVIIRIYDNKNQMIGKVDKVDLGKGQQGVTWDGIGLDGQIAPKEQYHFDVIAFDDKNEKFMGVTRAEGTVSGVRFENGETILDVSGGRKVYLKDVESFSLPEKDVASKNVPALQKQAASTYNQVDNQTN
ncbi:MAG: flagellar hook assembly protein FlgD [Bacteriovorax sp.]|nr:flagellar hook assembly protein FlgD [Bacteriovorax sp.]